LRAALANRINGTAVATPANDSSTQVIARSSPPIDVADSTPRITRNAAAIGATAAISIVSPSTASHGPVLRT